MGTPKYERLKQVIKNNIRDGIWKSGDKLPAENVLCQQLGVSKITVKKAKDDLIAEGVLENLPGRKGTFVRQKNRLLSTDLIGVVIESIQDPFTAMLQGIEDKLWEHGLHTILCTAYFDLEKVNAYFQSLLQREVAGVIFAPVRGRGYIENNKEIIDMLTERNISCVLLDRYIPGLLVNSVISNNYQASKELIRLLLTKGHTRILVVAGVECSSINDRLQGYRDALQEAGLGQYNSLIIRIDDILLETQEQHHSEELERIRDLVEKAGNFTACYTLNRTALKAAIRSIFPKVKKSKKDIEIVTYDDITNDFLGVINHATIVRQPGYRMGWEAARLLIDTLNSPDSPIIQMTLTSEIIEKVIE